MPFGLIGGRLYHVLTDWLCFGDGRDPWRALQIWQGGLGVWGAISLGAVGAWIGCRRAGIRLPRSPTPCRSGIAVAQAIGRFGNLNQRACGRPTDLPSRITASTKDHRLPGYEDIDLPPNVPLRGAVVPQHSQP